MKVNDIIVLENKARYTLLKKLEYEKEIYFLAAAISEDEVVDDKHLVYFKRIIEEDGEYVDLILDQDLIVELTKLVGDEKKDA